MSSRDDALFRRKALFKRAPIILTVLLLAICGGSWLIMHRSAATPAVELLAVLPLENLTHDQNKEYLSDGVTETLINSLSQLPRVKVIARNSVFRYKGHTLDLGLISRELGVQAILTGRVIEQGDVLTVSVELTDTRSNTQLWGQHYSRRAADILAVQDDIARQVTDALRLRLTIEQRDQITQRHTDNPEAYRLYLQGRYYFNKGGEEDLTRAIQFLDQAVALDSGYALAYATRGECYFSLGDLSLPMKEAMARSKQSALMALSIDSKLVEALTILANIKFQYEWNFAEAERDFKQAISLNPNYAEAHHQYGGYFLPLTGRPVEGVSEMQLAYQLDPQNPSIRLDRCLPYYLSRQFDEAITIDRKAMEDFPDFFLTHMALGNVATLMGDYLTGIAELEKAKALEPTPIVIGNLGYSYAKSGRKDNARGLLAELIEQSKQRYVAPYWIAMIYVGLDEKDSAFIWLNKAFDERSFFLLWSKTDPMLDSLRPDPRFDSLLRRIGLPR